MKKLSFWLQKQGVSQANGGIIGETFTYDYHENMTLNDLFYLCTKIIEDVKKFMEANYPNTKVYVCFGQSSGIIADFIAGYIEENHAFEDGIAPRIFREKTMRGKS